MNSDETLTNLRAAVAAAATPAERAGALNQLAEELERQGEYAESLAAAEEAQSLAKEVGDGAAEAEALRLQGIIHAQREEYSTALLLFEEELQLHEELGGRASVARVVSNIGNVYMRLSEYPKTLECFSRALLLYEELGERSGVARVMGNIGTVYQNLSEYPKALEYLSNALAIYEELGERSGIALVTGNIGNVYLHLSEYPKALESYMHALAMHEELGDRSGVARVVSNIGNVYTYLSEYPKALEYYTRALALHEELGERSGVAIVTGNIGTVLSDYAKALEYLSRALALHEELGNRTGVARATGSIGAVYADLSEYPKALEYYTRALALHEELGDRTGVARVTGNIGLLYSQQAFAEYNPTKAEELLQQAIALNEELGTKQNLYVTHQALAELYEQEGRFEEALTYFKKFHEVQEEVQSEEAKKKAIQVEQQRQIAEMEKRTAAERARAKATEELLHKTLPPSIADRMISGERQIADRFDSASILFADVVGFTPMTAQMPASAVLEFMNFVFAHFDSIAAKHGCERIKTIGDGYMAACGAPIEYADHAERIARMAMEMLEDVALPASITEHLPPNTEFEIRIGLHTGSITGGVIGTGKLAYDIYGDAVNTASRMESHGEAGKIHVSEEFAEELRRSGGELSITLEERGELTIKGKGTLRTYFLNPSTK
ncbi:MAG: tetratricopeptide repeat protein [Chlorobi bacterium]|nr:tetratricopeptide repeat protein [Chlorobiota bacterium]